MNIVLDTCALLWFTLDTQKMSKKALKVCEEAEISGSIYVSSISLWEIGLKIKNSKLDIGMTIEKYTRSLESVSTINIVPITTEHWLQNLKLKWNHRDPADRVIVALAKLEKRTLITKDEKIRAYFNKSLW